MERGKSCACSASIFCMTSSPVYSLPCSRIEMNRNWESLPSSWTRVGLGNKLRIFAVVMSKNPSGRPCSRSNFSIMYRGPATGGPVDCFALFFLMRRPPPRSTPYPTLFPYTTLFRSPGSRDGSRYPRVAELHPRGPCEVRRPEEHTSELQSHSETSYAVFCLKKKNRTEDISKEGQPITEVGDIVIRRPI